MATGFGTTARVFGLWRSVTLSILAVASLAGAEGPPAAPESDREALRATAEQIFGTLPSVVRNKANPITKAKIDLGRMLFFDPRLSKNQDISCNSCHRLDGYGVDNEPTSPGHRGQRGGRNSPTVYNAALHIAQFWDGRAADLEEQAKGPILNPVEMAMANEAEVISVLDTIPNYRELFRKAFPADPDPMTYDNLARAIGAFERMLMTPSRFDDFLSGDLEALSAPEIEGLETFIATGCPTCHVGPALGGGMYQKIGLVHPYETEDTGRHALTGNEADRYFFKVPSLRNIEKTGPYFHDGSIQDLNEAVRLMAWHQLGRELPEQEKWSIVMFLISLTGRVDPHYVALPELPASGPATPAPDPN